MSIRLVSLVTKGISREGNNCIYNYKVSNLLYSFGENTKPLPQIPPFFASVKEALNDRILLALAVAAFLTIIAGMVKDWRLGWVEGFSIYLAILIVVMISSANDWMKDKQFVRLQSTVKDENIAVIRGKYGAT